MVNPAGVSDVFSLYTHSNSRLDLLSGLVKVYSYTVLCTIVYDDDDDDYAGLSSGAGTNLKVGGTCQANT